MDSSIAISELSCDWKKYDDLTDVEMQGGDTYWFVFHESINQISVETASFRLVYGPGLSPSSFLDLLKKHVLSKIEGMEADFIGDDLVLRLDASIPEKAWSTDKDAQEFFSSVAERLGAAEKAISFGRVFAPFIAQHGDDFISWPQERAEMLAYKISKISPCLILKLSGARPILHLELRDIEDSPSISASLMDLARGFHAESFSVIESQGGKVYPYVDLLITIEADDAGVLEDARNFWRHMQSVVAKYQA